MSDSRRSVVVPLMKALVPVEMQLEFPLPRAEDPIREPFAGQLYVTYALEHPEHFEYVARRHCGDLGLPPDGLREQAVANLRTRRPNLSLTWSPDVRAVQVAFGGDLEAGLLLDDGFLDKLAQDVDGDLVVAVPARDTFVATGTGHPDGIDRLRQAVDQVWSDDRGDADNAPLSGDRPHTLLIRDLLVRRDDAWAVLV